MKKRPKEPAIPVARHETVRQKIMLLLRENTFSAKDISSEVGLSEREVYEHLEHIQRTAHKDFVVIPPVCRKCGFVFRKRERLKKPGRCPVCRSELIQEPVFSIRASSSDVEFQ
jgi:predicted Zn-ribbon and HTH transcriptional regulator